MIRAAVVLVVVAVSGCQDKPTGDRSATTATAKATVYTRDEFRKLVVGLTPDEVIKAAGKPEETHDSGRVIWVYLYRTRDPITGKTDTSAKVVFTDGRVSRVVY